MTGILPDLEIPHILLQGVLDHARREYPLECCGILAGKKGKATRVFPLKNIDRSRTSYLADPEDQLRVFQEMDKAGLELTAIYHSHPHSPPFPSPKDIQNAFYPDSFFMIVSLEDLDSPQVRAFCIQKGKAEERSVKVLPS